jgi:RNA polymerase sigma factor (sigma-70 family)
MPARRMPKKRLEKLVEDHTHVVDKIARQVHRKMTHVDFEELRQAGFVGLLEAASRYSKDKGVFEHFAYFRIRGAMIDAHKRSAYINETLVSLDGIRERLGYIPREIEQRKSPRLSVMPAPDDLAIEREQRKLLADALSGLTADEKKVFLSFMDGRTLDQTAAECDRSVAWARTKLASARSYLGARVIAWGIHRDLDKAA